jgi:hypothetical protein
MGSSEMAPDWVIAEMPPGYGTRVAEIRRLTQELEAMEQFARLLYEHGERLGGALHALFSSLDIQSQIVPDEGCAHLVVVLEPGARLLFHVSNEAQAIQKKSTEIAHVFRIIHEDADEHDRVVLVTNREPGKPPNERGPAVTPEAEAFLARLGVNHLPAASLFALWKLSLEDRSAARQQLLYLHAHQGGTFALAGSTLLR